MTDTLREKLASILEPQAWAALGSGDSLAYENRRKSSLRKIDDVLAHVARWALEPAQVERAAAASWDSDPSCGWYVGLDDDVKEEIREDNRAAIAALFERKTT